jgi:ubiquinone/menaquinone biosynthesis C-methylase UbiE
MADQEKERAIYALLNKLGIQTLENKKILEIGGGNGVNQYMFLRLGTNPEDLYFNELIRERFDNAKRRLPSSVNFFQGDARDITLSENSMDIVFQSVVFSSILSDKFKKALASKLLQIVKPGGGILWYDFIYNNPSNPDVKGIGVKEIKNLFPKTKIIIKKVTLAPPINRKVTKIASELYTLLNRFVFLRTHVICWIEKPRNGLT